MRPDQQNDDEYDESADELELGRDEQRGDLHEQTDHQGTDDGKRIAVLGEMGELGKESESGHREVGECAAELGIDHLIAIGETGSLIARAAEKSGLEKSVTVGSTSEAAEMLADIVAPGDLVLIKGSRTARTERVLEEFAARQPTEGARS